MKLPSLQEMLGLSRAQLGEFILAALELAIAPKPKPRWGLYRHIFDETNGEPTGVPLKTLWWTYIDKEAALSALRRHLEYPLPHCYWDLEEIEGEALAFERGHPTDPSAAEEEKKRPSVRQTVDNLQARITNISSDLEAQRAYNETRRVAYERGVLHAGHPLTSEQFEAWHGLYPPYSWTPPSTEEE